MSYGGYQQQAPPGGYPGQGYGAPPGGYGAPGQSAYASVLKRFIAHILDGIIVGIGALPGIILIIVGAGLAAATANPGGRNNDAAAAGMVGIVLLGYLVIFLGAIALWLYNCYLLGRDGATLGKRIMKIKVLDLQGQPLGFGKAFVRELVKLVLGNACFILLLWPLWDNEKQGLQDKIFSTHVFEA
ncbi:MAG TPA: RDD family protein [Blastocatellia bacterium]|nr:RDD family protein [Blastocatellia bacterium]